MAKNIDDEKVKLAVVEKEEDEFIGLDGNKDIDTDAMAIVEEIENNRPKEVSKDKTGSKKNYKVTKEEKLVRLREIFEVSNRGFNYSEIVQYGQQRWGVTERTIERYIAEAKDLNVFSPKDAKEYRSDSIARCNYIYKLAIKNKNAAIALQAQKEINKIRGIYSDTMIEPDETEESLITQIKNDISSSGLKDDDIVAGVIEVDDGEEE